MQIGKKNATVERLKKAYSTLSNAVTASIAINGPIETWSVPSVSPSGSSSSKIVTKEFAEEYLIPYLNVAQICEHGKDDGCNYQIGNSGYAFANGINHLTYSDFLGEKKYGFVLADGTTVSFSVAFVDGEIYSSEFAVDINGPKKPNKVGRDVFVFGNKFLYEDTILTKKLIDSPCNMEKLGREACKNYCKRMSRAFCTGLIMADGWQIKDDYPW